MSKKIIVTGANGQLGRAIRKLYEGNTEYEIVATDVVEGQGIKPLDITDVKACVEMVQAEKPYAILNCAAFTNVDGCEVETDLAYKINAIGPRNLSIAATEAGAKMFHISTDYVFPGTENKALTEFDQVGPISAYGRTKLAGEYFVKEFSNRYFIVRTAWLYGDGKNFVKTMLHLAQDHDEVNVVNDQIGSPTSAAELAKAIAYLIPTDNYGLFHGTCEGQCAWSDFTKEIYRLGHVDTVVNPISSAKYKELFPASADRPAYSILDNYMLRLTGDFRFAQWQDAIQEYLKD